MAAAAAAAVGGAQREVMAPHLEAMCKELQAAWPQLEPELLLARWLCERHSLELPQGSLQKKKGTPRKFPSVSVSDAGSSPKASPRTILPEVPFKGNTVAVPVDSQAISTATPGSTGPLVHNIGGSGPIVDYARRLREGDAVEPELNVWGAFNSYTEKHKLGLRDKLRQQNAADARLRQLERISVNVCQDAVRDNVKTANQKALGIHSQIATMRQDLRGKFVSNVPLLSPKVLTLEEQKWLVGRLRPWNYDKGDVIVQEGAVGDNLFIIERGDCTIWKVIDGVETKICTIHKGSFFGELSVMYDMPRSATVIANTGVTVLSLSRGDIHATLSADKIEKMKILARTQIFFSIPAFSRLDAKWKVRIASSLVQSSWPRDAVILREGLKMEGNLRRLYIIESGTCIRSTLEEEDKDDSRWGQPHVASDKKKRLHKRRSVFMQHEHTCKEGSFCGMLEMLYGCPQQCTFTAASNVTLLSISHSDLQGLFETDADSLFGLMRNSVTTSLLASLNAKLKEAEDADILEILATTPVKQYAQWEPIFTQGEFVDTVCMLLLGTAIEYVGDASTLREQTFDAVDIVEHNRPGDHFGTRCLIGAAGAVAPFTVVATSPCEVLKISLQRLQQIIKGTAADAVEERARTSPHSDAVALPT